MTTIENNNSQIPEYIDNATASQLNNVGLHNSFEGLTEQSVDIYSILEEVNRLISNETEKIELTKNISIKGLINHILKSKEQILEGIKDRSSDPEKISNILSKDNNGKLEINSDISDEQYFDILIKHLSVQKNISLEELNTINGFYSSYITKYIKKEVNRQASYILSEQNRDILSNKGKKNMKENNLEDITSLFNTPGQSKLILSYLNKYPENASKIIDFTLKNNIELTFKLIETIKSEKVIYMLTNESTTKEISDILNEREVINFINRCTIKYFFDLKNKFGKNLVIELITTLGYSLVTEIGIDELIKYKQIEIKKFIELYKREKTYKTIIVPANLKKILKCGVQNSKELLDLINKKYAIDLMGEMDKDSLEKIGIPEIVKYYCNCSSITEIKLLINILKKEKRLPKKRPLIGTMY